MVVVLAERTLPETEVRILMTFISQLPEIVSTALPALLLASAVTWGVSFLIAD